MDHTGCLVQLSGEKSDEHNRKAARSTYLLNTHMETFITAVFILFTTFLHRVGCCFMGSQLLLFYMSLQSVFVMHMERKLVCYAIFKHNWTILKLWYAGFVSNFK